MDKLEKLYVLTIVILILILSVGWCYTLYHDDPEDGQYLGEFNGVNIYGDPTTYPYGNTSNKLRFQCVEYVRRYYYQKHNTILPNISTGCAKDIINEYEGEGGLMRFLNNSSIRIPVPGDIIVFNATTSNPYGHVAIISEVNLDTNRIRFAQQNWPGHPFGEVSFSRNDQDIINIENYEGYEVLGFLSPVGLEIIYKDCHPKQNSQINLDEKAWIVFNHILDPEIKGKTIRNYIEFKSKSVSNYKATRIDLSLIHI